MAMADRWSGITESFIFLKKEYGYKFNCQDPACSFRQKLNLACAATLVNVSSWFKSISNVTLKQNISLNVTFLTLLVVKFVKFWYYELQVTYKHYTIM